MAPILVEVRLATQQLGLCAQLIPGFRIDDGLKCRTRLVQTALTHEGLSPRIIELGDRRIARGQFGSERLDRRDHGLPPFPDHPGLNLLQSNDSPERRRILGVRWLVEEGRESGLGRGGVPGVQGGLGAQESGFATVR